MVPDYITSYSQNGYKICFFFGSRSGPQVNMDKTKYMTVATMQSDVSVPGLGSLQQIDDFKNLGSIMASSQAHIAIRRGQAWGVFWNMKAIWRSTELPLHLRVRIFFSTCLSILLYGSEAWSLTKAITSRLDSFARSCYRDMIGFKRTDHVRNEVILQAVCQKPPSTVIKQRQLRWLRAPEDDPTRRYELYAPAHGH